MARSIEIKNQYEDKVGESRLMMIQSIWMFGEPLQATDLDGGRWIGKQILVLGRLGWEAGWYRPARSSYDLARSLTESVHRADARGQTTWSPNSATVWTLLSLALGAPTIPTANRSTHYLWRCDAELSKETVRFRCVGLWRNGKAFKV